MKNRRGRSTSKHKTPAKTPVLVPQVHGGALKVGGNPGNRGGPGRPRDRVRQSCLESFEKRIPVLEQIADGEPVQKIRLGEGEEVTEAKVSASPAERIKAVEALGKFGLPPERMTFGMAGEFGEGDEAVRFTLILGERSPHE